MLPYCSAFPPELEKSDGTKRSLSSSFCFKIRRHKVFMEVDGYIEGSWHEIISQNDPRQGKNDHGKDTK